MIAALAGSGVFLLVLAIRPARYSERVSDYLAPAEQTMPARGLHRAEAPAWIGVGAVCGGLLVPSWSIGSLVGAAVGAWGWRTTTARRASSRRRRLGFELPAIIDLLVLYLVSGESVIGSLQSIRRDAVGVAVDEIDVVLRQTSEGSGLVEALTQMAHGTAHDDASRLYLLLAEGHRSGARLIEGLRVLASDRRAAIGREITEEGGRRALTGYGPILGLMIPTTLVFLMYPTLAGLDALSAP